MSVRGKRLLLLGGTPLMCHVVQKAREMGVYTIVTDYYDATRAPAKTIADEAHAVSTLAVDELVQLARERAVDGVFTGYSDVTLVPCRQVCEALGLPFYATLEQIELASNKRQFKACCRAHGIRVVDDLDLKCVAENPETIRFPVIVKPADSYGSRGISVCHDAQSLRDAVDGALAFSACKEVVVEEYLSADDIYMYFTVQDGTLSLSAMADRLLNAEQAGVAPQPIGYFFPSRYLDAYYEQLHDKLQHLLETIGLKNGTFFVQGFVRNGEILLFEMGLRLSGGAGYLSITHQNGIDPVKMHLNYALTGVFSGWNIQTDDNPYFARPHCVVVVLLRNGTIGRIAGWSSVVAHPAVFDTVRLCHEGDVLTRAGTLDQVFARIFMSADSPAELRAAIRSVQQTLVINDTDGENMLLHSFDARDAFAGQEEIVPPH